MSSSSEAPPKMIGSDGWRAFSARASARLASTCWNTSEKPTSPNRLQSTLSTQKSMKRGAASSRSRRRSSSEQSASWQIVADVALEGVEICLVLLVLAERRLGPDPLADQARPHLGQHLVHAPADMGAEIHEQRERLGREALLLEERA